jgi:hypothetical protein
MGRLRTCGDCGKGFPLLFGHREQCTQRRVELVVTAVVLLSVAIGLTIATGSPARDLIVPTVAGIVGCVIARVLLRARGRT